MFSMPVPRRFPRDRRLPGIPGALVGGVALAVFVLARRYPQQVESLYGQGLYPGLARLLGNLTGWIPFSLAEWMLLALAVSLGVALPLGYVRARRRSWSVPRALLAAGLALLGTAGAWWAAFVLLWGLNYARPLPEAAFRLAPAPDREAWRALAAEVSQRLDAERALVEEDGDGVARTPDMADLDAHLRGLQAAVLRDAGLRPVDAGRAKRFAISPLLLRWGVSGMYGPFTGEPNIVVPAPPALLPSTLAHERAHLSGFASEETASFVALLTCWRSPRPAVRYAAWLDLWLALKHEPARRSAGVKRDLAALADFVEAHRGREAPVMWTAYSGYLKAHGVKGGIRSYGRVADLALRWIEAHGMPPVRSAAEPP